MVTFFDANIAFGAPSFRQVSSVSDAAGLRRVMEEHGISRCLAWHYAQVGVSPQDGNELLCRALAGCDDIVGSLVLLPPQTKETPFPDILARMRQAGCRAIRLFPDTNRYILSRTVFGAVFDEVSERRIPVLIPVSRDTVGSYASYDAIYRFLADYPRVTCIIVNTGIWGADRFFRPLVERYERVFVETSYLCLTADALESFVRDCGADRLVFGSGFPERYIGASVMEILHARISDEEKQAIASGTMERILAEVDLR